MNDLIVLSSCVDFEFLLFSFSLKFSSIRVSVMDMIFAFALTSLPAACFPICHVPIGHFLSVSEMLS